MEHKNKITILCLKGYNMPKSLSLMGKELLHLRRMTTRYACFYLIGDDPVMCQMEESTSEFGLDKIKWYLN